MSSKSYIYFGIHGEFDPDLLAAEIGVKPTMSMAKHARVPEKQLPRHSLLRFAQTYADDSAGFTDIYELSESVYRQLKDYKKQIASAVKVHSVEATFQVVLYFPVSDDISTPAIGFSKEVVAFIAEVGASIDIDTYRE